MKQAQDDSVDYREETTVPVIAEELRAGTRKVKTGGVRVHKTIEEHEEILDQPLLSEHVQVRRVVKNEIVEGPLATRTVGDTIIVPVVKEVLKVEKQFVLTEEFHITRQAVEERHQEKVLLKEEHAELERVDAAGNRVARLVAQEPRTAATDTAAPKRLSPKERVLAREGPRRPRKSILRND